MGYPLLKYANFSTLLTFCFYGLKRVLLRKQHHQTTKPRSLLMKRRLKRCLKLLSRFKRLPLSKYADSQTIVKCRFYGLKRLLLRKQHHQTTKLETSDQNHELPLLKHANFSTIKKCRFYSLKSLLLTEQHYQRPHPRSLLQKRRLKRYLKLLTRIMG